MWCGLKHCWEGTTITPWFNPGEQVAELVCLTSYDLVMSQIGRGVNFLCAAHQVVRIRRCCRLTASWCFLLVNIYHVQLHVFNLCGGKLDIRRFSMLWGIIRSSLVVHGGICGSVLWGGGNRHQEIYDRLSINHPFTANINNTVWATISPT